MWHRVSNCPHLQLASQNIWIMLEAGFAANFNARKGRCDPFQGPLQDGECNAVNTDSEYKASFQIFLASYYLCHQVSSSNSSVSKEEVSANMLHPQLEELENLGLSWRVHESSRHAECCRVDGIFFCVLTHSTPRGVWQPTEQAVPKRNTFLHSAAFILWLALPGAASLQ